MPKKQNKLAHCRVILEGEEHTYEGDSGEEGLINFEKIEEDVYTLIVKKDGYEDYVEENIVIDENNKTLRSKVALKELPHEITLVILTTPAVAHAGVTIIDTDGHIAYHGKTDEDGQLTIPKVQYGKYMLKVNATGYNRYVTNIRVNNSNKNPRTIEVPLTETEPQNVDPEPDTTEDTDTDTESSTDTEPDTDTEDEDTTEKDLEDLVENKD